MGRTGTTGRGREILVRKEEVSDALLAFLGQRMPKLPRAKKFATKNEKKEKRGKTLNYERESKDLREGLDISRKEEWNKWTKFMAGRPIRGKELQELLSAGHVPIPTRWVDVDRAAHKRRAGGPFVPPDLKSRLTARGDLEGLDGIRSDSPTAETEAHHLLFSWAASNKVTLKTGDISNAYFQSEELDRLLLLKPPKGIPDPDYEDGEAMILARVPIYGTSDAGRKFWQKFRTVITESGFRENKIAQALYILEEDGDIKGMLITHVDDLCWAVKPGYEKLIQEILDKVVEKKVEETKFRFVERTSSRCQT